MRKESRGRRKRLRNYLHNKPCDFPDISPFSLSLHRMNDVCNQDFQ